MAQKPPLGARKDEKWYAIGIEPSITKTPIGPIQVPVPYQVISDLSTAMGTSNNVTFNGQPAYLLDQSTQPQCTGDEQGSSGGTRSGTTSMEVKPVAGSGSVKINGKAVIRNGDPCTLNKENCRGKYVQFAPPTKDYQESDKVRIRVFQTQELIAPNDVVELSAIVTPSEASLEWSISEPFEFLETNDSATVKGSKIVRFQMKTMSHEMSNLTDWNSPATLSVTALHPNRKSKVSLQLPIHATEMSCQRSNDQTKSDEKEIFSLKAQPGAGGLSTTSQKKMQVVAKRSPVISQFAQWIKAEKERQRVFLTKTYQNLAEREERIRAHTANFASEIWKHLEQDGLALNTKVDVAAKEVATGVAGSLNSLKSRFDLERINSTALYNALDLTRRLLYGQFAFNQDGDSRGLVLNDIAVSERDYEFTFGKERLALVVVPGMNWEYMNTREMQLSCEASFGVASSIRIRNYTGHFRVASDTIQSAYSELGAFDPHAVATAVALAAGIIKEQKPTYIVAHSQGSEICRAAFEFICLMEQIPPELRKLIFTTHIFQQATENILTHLFSGGDNRFRHSWKGINIDPDLITAVGELNAEKRKRIYYQGFGSESYIHNELYGLGNVRNSRTHGDYIPVLGETAKLIKSALQFKQAHPVMGAEIAKEVFSEEWDYVYSFVNAAHRKWPILGDRVTFTLDRHEWYTNYWPNLKVPNKALGVPNQKLNFTFEEKKEIGDRTLVRDKNFAARHSGLSCTSNTSINKGAAITSRDLPSSIALFFDDVGNGRNSNSNIVQILNATVAYKESQRKESLQLEPYYYTLAQSHSWDPWAEAIGSEARDKLEKAYKFIVATFWLMYGGSPNIHIDRFPNIHIDLYGFGRGAAIASSLAWILRDKGIPGGNGSCSGRDKVKVRFLGLFDTVHCMKVLGTTPLSTNQGMTQIAPNVESAAHAFSGDERRVYLKPSVLAKSNSTTKLSQIIFPGVHNDIGGHPVPQRNNNGLLLASKLWMIQKAIDANVDYFADLKTEVVGITEETLKKDLLGIKPGEMEFPDGILDRNPLDKKFREQSRNQIGALKTFLVKSLDLPEEKNAKDEALDLYLDEKIATANFINGGQIALPTFLCQKPYNLFEPRAFPSTIHQLGSNYPTNT